MWQARHPLYGDFEGRNEGGFSRDGDLFRVRRLEEEPNGFEQIPLGFLDRVPLACNVELGAGGDVPVPLAFDDCRNHVGHVLYPPSSSIADD